MNNSLTPHGGGRNVSKFVSEFLSGKVRSKDLVDGGHTVHNDHYDREDLSSILDEVRPMSVAEDALADFVSTGREAIGDTFFSTFKANVELKPSDKIRPSHQINRVVMDEAHKLTEYEQLRVYTAGDEIAAAMGVVKLEPELETIFDKLKQEQKAAQQLQQMMGQFESQEEDLDSIAEALAAVAEGQTDAQGRSQQELEDAKAQAEASLEQTKKAMEDLANGIDDGIEEKIPEIKDNLKDAFKKAEEEAGTEDSLSRMWSSEVGGQKKMSAENRIKLAERMKNNEKFAAVAKLIGPLTRMAMAEQQKKVNHAAEEVMEIELGSDITRVLPIEMLALDNEALKLDFFRKLVENNLLQYKMRGTDKIAKGGIIFAEDGSGSMHGGREIWAKACGLAFMHIARVQKRDFYAIHFGGPGEFKTFHFPVDGQVVVTYKNKVETFDFLDGVIAFAETFFGGGTDFHTPLTVALEFLQKQYEHAGEVKADIVFTTDGQCDVADSFMEEFKEEQERLAFKVFGLAIDTPRESEPLATICDHHVFQIEDLVSGESVRDVFRTV